jgi:glycosyltransferase involved in cell wall biosynthesis
MKRQFSSLIFHRAFVIKESMGTRIANKQQNKLRVLTWHIHGNYLHYLSHADIELLVPVRPGRPDRYLGTPPGMPWRENVREIDADEVQNTEFDCVLFQHKENYLADQFEILSPAQRLLPQAYLEHDPPQKHPTDTVHPAKDDVLLVHVTHFNQLMWQHAGPSRVIEHGVVVSPGAAYSGEKERGIAVVNNLLIRGRRLGKDVFEQARAEVPLDLLGMGSRAIGGSGSLPFEKLHTKMGRYRFFFNPIRYTSLPLSLCEAMMLGMPVVALATTEIAEVLRDGDTGFVSTDPARLVRDMRALLEDPELARTIGARGQEVARERFSIERFARQWEETLAGLVADKRPQQSSISAYLSSLS